MDQPAAVTALAALAQDHRIAVFRLLMRQGANGLPAGDIADAVGVPPSTLSSHLAQMERAGLLRSWRHQRYVFYAVDLEGARQLVEFLTEQCCEGRPEICGYRSGAEDRDAAPQGKHRQRGEEAAMGEARVYNVLFLCTGNSARSIMAEAILDRAGMGRFKAYSAGSHPKGEVHRYALEMLKAGNYPTAHLRSKSWEELSGPAAPPLDFVFTVCDNAASEVCPVWPGQPMTAHWGIPDPAAVEGSEAVRRLAFAEAMRFLTNRIDIFVSLPMRSLDRMTLRRRLNEIGRTMPESA